MIKLFLLAFAVVFTSALLAEETHYELTEIVPPAGGSLVLENSTTYPFKLFDSGRVFGFYQLSGTYRAFVWKSGVFTDLGPAPNATPIEIHEIGSTGGFIGKFTDIYGLRLVAWKNASYAEIAPPVGETLYSALFTDTGRIAGVLTTAGGSPQVYVWFDGNFGITSPPAGTSSLSISNVTPDGHVFGSYNFNQFIAFDGVFTDLAPPSGFSSFYSVRVVTDSVIAGSGLLDGSSGSGYALFTQMDGTLSTTPVPSGYYPITVVAINSVGRGTGYADFLGSPRPFTWFNGTFATLLPGSLIGSTEAISESGRIIGSFGEYPGRAFTWFDGVFTDLTPQAEDVSYAIAINSDGRIIGYYYHSNSVSRPFTWFNGTFTDLSPSGSSNSGVTAINENGRIIGYSDNGAFTWADGVFTSLGPPGTSALVINAADEILVTSSPQAWIAELKPGPEPTPSPSPTTMATPEPTPLPSPPAASLTGKIPKAITKSKFVIKGKASSGVTAVTYRIGNGQWQKAVGTANWTINVKLKPGKNIIAIVAHGPGGNSKPVKITITRKMPS